MRYLLTFFTLFLSLSVYAQTDSIFPAKTGEALINSLQSDYSITFPLSYNVARDKMYGEIDNHDGKVTGVYSGFTVTANTRSSVYAAGINAEHTWPQGKFNEASPMRSDIHHLYPTKIDVNSARSHYKFDEIPDNNTTKWFRGSSNQTSIPTSNIDEYSELLSETSFEPREDHKGNVARAIFYFWTIYQDRSEVADDESFFTGMKDVLLTWHDLDPVDQAEVQRSLAVEKAQGNRNPFIHDTTLVRRAYFGAEGNPVEVLNNPLVGTVTDITNNSFVVSYSNGSETKSTDFNYDINLTSKDHKGNPFELIDYEYIEAASINWENIDDSTEAKKATLIEVIRFGDSTPPDSVTGAGSETGLIITGIFDGMLTGGTPKGIELYANEDIEDLSIYGIGSANNGEGSDGVELQLSGYTTKGSFIFIATEETSFNTWFKFNADFIDDMAVAINGNDAIELFYDSTATFSGNEIIIDVFGEPNSSASSWNYENGWAYRMDFTGPDGNTFVKANWEISPGVYNGASTNDGSFKPMPILTFKPKQVVSIADDIFNTPTTVELANNYPNPFNPTTIISYAVHSAQNVKLAVYDQLGREISVLTNGMQSSGNYTVTFDASQLSSGVYFYQLKTAEGMLTKKMLLIK